MNKLKSNDREIIAEKLMDLGNLVFVGLFISQLVPEIKIKLIIILIAVLSMLITYFFALVILKGGGKK